MLAHMENKIASVEQEVEVVKSTGMKIMDATNVSFSGLGSLMQSLGITDAVLNSAEGLKGSWPKKGGLNWDFFEFLTSP